jgi:outer membrane protein OmpA-like peptidoglycan-associated protein
MKRTMTAFLIATLALIATPAFAQDDEEDAAEPEASATEEDGEETWMTEVKPESGLLEFGFFLGAFMPSKDHNLRDDALPHQSFGSVGPEIGLRLAYFPLSWFGLEGETGFVTTSTKDDDETASIAALRAHGIVQLPGYRLTPFVLVGGGQLLSKSKSIGDDDDPSFHFGVGAKLALSRSLSIRLDLRNNISSANPATIDDNNGAAHHQELLLGLTWTFGRSDPPPKDRDKDGFADPNDACPDDPGVEPDGCPLPTDRDGDGIMDPDDKCVGDPEDKDGFEDEDGCPDRDNDQDGILDADDKCLNDAEDKDGFEDEDGCPDPDNDKDGVPDTEDECPLKRGIVKWNGCPGQKKVVVVGDEIQILEKVFFDTGKTTIKQQSFALLDEVAEVINDNPLVKKIEVQGHTDDVGGDKANLKLSDGRANSVMNYLVMKGVAAGRLQAKGFGETAPLQVIKGLKGKSVKEARSKNRRVQFKILEQDRKTEEIEVAPEKAPENPTE